MDDYKVERGLFDAWARWIDNCDRAAILAHWYPRQDSTSRLADRYGKPDAAPTEYLITQEELARSEAISRLAAQSESERCERVDRFMAGLKTTAPMQHLCIEARHRRVVGSVHVGTRKGANGRRVAMREIDLAAICIKGNNSMDAKLSAFKRHCVLAYQGFTKSLDF